MNLMLLARVNKERMEEDDRGRERMGLRMRIGLRMDGGMQLAVHGLAKRPNNWVGGEKWFLFGLLRPQKWHVFRR